MFISKNIDKIKNINTYWIYFGDFLEKSSEKISPWNTEDKVSIKNNEFLIIKTEQ